MAPHREFIASMRHLVRRSATSFGILIMTCLTVPALQGQSAGAWNSDSLFASVAGQWDWVHGDSTCRSSSLHQVSFSPDRNTMRIAFLRPATDTGQKEYTYRITQYGEGLFPGTDRVIRGEMQGETRQRSDNPGLVVWDLVLVTPNQYRWHRTDWPEGAITGAVARCADGAPVDRWAGGWSNAARPVFRHTIITDDTLRLGKPWRSAARWGATDGDTSFVLPQGAFGGADLVRVHRDSLGLVRQLDFAYLPARAAQVDEAVHEYTGMIGEPHVESESTPAVRYWGVGWRDRDTELLLVRFTPEQNGIHAVVILKDQLQPAPGKE